jgi:hypothetical protein
MTSPMKTNSALVVPAQPPAATNDPIFIEAPKPLMDIHNLWFWFWLIAVLTVLAIVAFILWRHWKNTASQLPPIPQIPPQVRARRLLEEALAFLLDPKVFTIRVSDTLRQYLEERFNFRAPERTTEEFLYALQNTPFLTGEQKLRLEEFLSACDLVKFAKYEPTEVELRNLHGTALKLVNETEPSGIEANIGQTVAPQPPPLAKS